MKKLITKSAKKNFARIYNITLLLTVLAISAIPIYSQTYCTPYVYNYGYGYISNFTFNGINNNSSYEYYGGYADYTSIVSNHAY